jgi:hypothetical protein
MIDESAVLQSAEWNFELFDVQKQKIPRKIRF